MALNLILKSVPIIISSLYIEIKIIPNYLNIENIILNINKFYSGVIIVNVVCSGLLLVVLGFKVGAARKKFTEKVF